MIISIPADTDHSVYENLNKLGNFFTTAYCGGVGLCGKCKIHILSGECTPPTKQEIKRLQGKISYYRLACQTRALTPLTVEIPDSVETSHILENYEGGISVDTTENGYGIAIDIGTTTIALFLVNLQNGVILKTFTALNNQKKYGADVISRIAYTEEHENGLAIVQRTITSQIEGHIHFLLDAVHVPQQELKKVVVAANTTMMHLLTGENPSGIGRAPFVPKFLEERNYTGNQLGMDLTCPFYLIGGISAYVGADITSGIHATHFNQEAKVNALFDLGTNGEIALWNKHKIITCSCAAGPVFEGASISCGCGSIEGAISAFHREDDGSLTYQTIGNKKAIGICGSGIIDLVALLLETNRIDYTGAMNEAFIIEGTDLSFTPRDVREVQFAKAAIAAGIEILLKYEGLNFHDIDTVFLAGGLGTFLNPQSAVAMGLVPIEDYTKIHAVGNSSLKGSLECLLSDKAKEEMIAIRKNAQYIELSTDKNFQKSYVDNMLFGSDEDEEEDVDDIFPRQ